MENLKYERCVLLSLVCLVISFYNFGQEKWIDKLQNPKEFIENKGQFNGKIKSSGAIKFGTNVDGFKIYFTSKGLTYQLDKDETERKEKDKSFDHKSAKKITSYELEEEREREIEDWKIIPYFIEMNWVNPNPDVEISKESEVLNYYTYNNPHDKTGTSGIKAKAFQKIIYKNLYPNIDIEYFFPKDRSGLKYNIILHPGANPDNIKMKYSKSGKCLLDQDGNLTISVKDKRIMEYAPVSYYED